MKYLLILIFMVGCASKPKSDFVEVDQMNCPQVKEMYSTRQLSELTETEKFVIGIEDKSYGAVECGVTFQKVRIRRDRIRSFYPSYGISTWRDEKDSGDPGAPIHITKYNVEHCRLWLAGPAELGAKEVTIAGTCKQLEEKLK